jgi:tetratricopeptide (TPR) repeat protein
MMSFLLLLAMGLQQPAADVVGHMQAGIAAEKLGQHDVAIAEFRQASQLQPDLAAAWVDLGTVYMGERNYAEAIAPLKRAVALDSAVPPVQEMLGYALLSRGYAAESIPYLQQAHNQGMLGLAEVQTGDLAEAIPHLQAALAQHPDDPELLSALARAAGELSRQSKDALLATHPESSQAHQALAADYWALQKETEAESEYQKALAIQPNLPGAHLALGQIYQDTQQWQKAEQAFGEEATLRPGSAEAAYRLGNALLQNGKVPAAETELRRANSLQPDMPETLFALGKAEALDGHSLAAENDWNRLLSLEKDTDLAQKTHFELAGVYRKSGKAADAAREMKAFQALKAQGKE